MAPSVPDLVNVIWGDPSQAATSEIDLCRSLIEHRLAGLAWSRFSGQAEALPAEVIRCIAMADLRTRAVHQRNWAALRDATDRFARVGVDVALLKGLTAEARWYKRSGERPSSDIDILVDPRTDVRPSAIIGAIDESHPIIPYVDGLVERGIVETVALRGATGATLDVHFELLELGVPLRMSAEIWDRSELRNHPDGGVIRVLDAETSLIHFLLHLNKDRFPRLLGYVDVVNLVREEPDLDWSYIHRFGRTEGLEVPIYMSLDAVYNDLGMEPPPHPSISSVQAWIWRVLWPRRSRLLGRGARSSHRRRQRLLALYFKGRRLRAIRWWARKVLPPDPLLAWNYPTAKGPYAVRLLSTRLIGLRRALSSRSGPR